MKTNIIKSFLITALFAFAVFATANAEGYYQSDSTPALKHSHMKMDKQDYSVPKEYKGTIDLKSIDVNKDGKIYQCLMDFNVLSDKTGKDPKCGMTLKEVSLEQAKSNLTKHGFKEK